MNVEWMFSTEWFEKGEQDRSEFFAEQFQFGNETEGRAAWGNALRFGWVQPHQFDPHVSPLYKLSYDVDNGQRSKLRSRVIVSETSAQRRAA